MDEILKYFPYLTPHQRECFERIGELYKDWNEKINVISRKDIDNLYAHHVLHSLAIAKFITPKAETQFIDLGTGGGFPGIPLAIMWPECKFHLIDRIGKKLTVAQDVAQKLRLTNVSFQHGDALECKIKADYVLSRAVMNLNDLVKISSKLISHKSHNQFPNGLICLKGGDLEGEISTVKRPLIQVPLRDYFNLEYYQGKELVYVEL